MSFGKRIFAGCLCATVVLCVGLFSAPVVKAHMASSPSGNMSLEEFIELSTRGIACSSRVYVDAGGKIFVNLEYDGHSYTATRSDGTSGAGLYLLTLTGRLPMAEADNTFYVLANEQYTFEEVGFDILGINNIHEESGADALDYFLIM